MYPEPIPDVIVLIPGILGSVLQRDNRDVWAVSGGGIGRALATGWDSIQKLALTADSPGRDLDDGVTAPRLIADVHLMPGLWKIDGYSRLRHTLTHSYDDVRPGINFFEFPYDWRRDNRFAAHRLKRATTEWLKARRATPGNESAKLILLCHSMGGLVARYFLEVLEGWRDTSALITFGTPFRGSLKALDFIANGCQKKLGPVPLVDLSNLLRSFTSVYQLLPIYPCYDDGSGCLLRPNEIRTIGFLDEEKARAAAAFHREIRDAVDEHLKRDDYRANPYLIHPVVGTRQPTLQSGRRHNGVNEFSNEYNGRDMDGDGTVPLVSATPIEIEKEKREIFVAEAHASLQNSGSVWDQIDGVIRNAHTDLSLFKAAGQELAPAEVKLSLTLDDSYERSEPIRVRVRPDKAAVTLYASINGVAAPYSVGNQRMNAQPDGVYETEFAPPPEEGVYRIRISGTPAVSPVTDVIDVA